MIKKYQQLDRKERERIFRLKQRGKNNVFIARELKRDKATIGRELKRNYYYTLNQYLPDTAQRKADKRKIKGRKKKYVDKSPALKKKIIKQLRAGDSPDLIAGRAKCLKKPHLNAESIYQFIYSLEGRKMNLRQYLIRAHRIRHHKRGRKSRHDNCIPNRVDISKRPKIVEKRKQFGHWEDDLIIYNHHQRALSTQVERKTRKVIISKPQDLTAKEKSKCLLRRFRVLPPQARKTMTRDNGRENTDHKTVTEAIGLKFYFARSYTSWQRGTNENRNGLIRFFLPRSTNLDQVTAAEIKKIENKINNRPMKCLGYQTPNEAFKVEMNKIILKQ